MNCCSNDEMMTDTLASMFQSGLKIFYGGIIGILTLGHVGTSGDKEDTSTTISKNTGSLFDTDTIVSILFVVHVAAVVAFIISHCRVVKKKSQ